MNFGIKCNFKGLIFVWCKSSVFLIFVDPNKVRSFNHYYGILFDNSSFSNKFGLVVANQIFNSYDEHCDP